MRESRVCLRMVEVGIEKSWLRNIFEVNLLGFGGCLWRIME